MLAPSFSKNKKNKKSFIQTISFGTFGGANKVAENTNTSNSSNLSPTTSSRTEWDLRRIEATLEVLSFTRDEAEAEDILRGNKDCDIIRGSVNGLQVLWDRPGNKLMVKDRKGLEKNILVEDGVPFVLVEYSTQEGRKYQRMIVSDYVR